MPDPVAKRFAENLADHVGKVGVTQEALAARAEVHRTQVSELLKGETQPRLGTIIRLAGALGIEPAALIDGIRFEPADASGKFEITKRKR